MNVPRRRAHAVDVDDRDARPARRHRRAREPDAQRDQPGPARRGRPRTGARSPRRRRRRVDARAATARQDARGSRADRPARGSLRDDAEGHPQDRSACARRSLPTVAPGPRRPPSDRAERRWPRARRRDQAVRVRRPVPPRRRPHRAQRDVPQRHRRRARARPVRLSPDDFEVERTELLTRSATVLMLDVSLSMEMRGRFLAAKKVAMALHALISSQFPRDYLGMVSFGRVAREVKPARLPEATWDFEWGTNMQHALALARKLLSTQSGRKQIIMITDGEPTAHIEDGYPYFDYPPSPRTIEMTLREVQRCTRENIRINTFCLEESYYLREFVERMMHMNRGRAFFTTPETLGDYVLVDFLDHKRKTSQARADVVTQLGAIVRSRRRRRNAHGRHVRSSGDRRVVPQEAHGRAVRRGPQGRHRARLHRRLLGLPRRRHVPCASAATRRCSPPSTSSTPAPAGRASGKPPRAPASRKSPTRAMAWSAPRSVARTAVPTSATCFPTAPVPRASVYSHQQRLAEARTVVIGPCLEDFAATSPAVALAGHLSRDRARSGCSRTRRFCALRVNHTKLWWIVDPLLRIRAIPASMTPL